MQHYNLLVNVSAKRLSETVDLEKCGLPNSGEFVTDNTFAPTSDRQSDKNIMTELHRDYPEVFDPALRSRVPKHSTETTVDTATEEPVTARCRRLSPEKYKALKVEIKRLCDQGILERSQSAWSSPIVMVKKKNGSYRMCAHLTNLNKILEVQKYSLPNLEDFTPFAHGCCYFSSIDIRDAYYSNGVKPEHQHKLSICTPVGNYCYRYLPMGLASSSCYFQRLMNEVIADIPQTIAYMDDVFLATSSLEEHLVLLRQIFSRLRDHGLIVNAEKCHFCLQELKFLGHKVTPAGILPNDEKVLAIRIFTLPHTKKQLKRYIGMNNFFAKFVPHSAEFLQPLHALAAHSSNNCTLSWTE